MRSSERFHEDISFLLTSLRSQQALNRCHSAYGHTMALLASQCDDDDHAKVYKPLTRLYWAMFGIG